MKRPCVATTVVWCLCLLMSHAQYGACAAACLGIRTQPSSSVPTRPLWFVVQAFRRLARKHRIRSAAGRAGSGSPRGQPHPELSSLLFDDSALVRSRSPRPPLIVLVLLYPTVHSRQSV